MKTLKQVDITFEKVQYIPDISELNDNVIYISDEFKVSVHKCLCGCNELTVMPLNNNNWNYIISNDNKISFQPSVGNFQYDCKSHYIITKNKANFV